MDKHMKLVVLAVCVYGALIVLTLLALARMGSVLGPVAQQIASLAVPVLLANLCNGSLKLINILQNRLTDKKVEQDLSETKAVKHAVNGGLEERMKKAALAALAAHEAAKAAAVTSPPSPEPERPRP